MEPHTNCEGLHLSNLFFFSLQAVLQGSLSQHYVFLIILMASDRFVCLRNLTKYMQRASKKVGTTCGL